MDSGHLHHASVVVLGVVLPLSWYLGWQRTAPEGAEGSEMGPGGFLAWLLEVSGCEGGSGDGRREKGDL